ncbi:MAG: hypothetical protein MUE73_07660 [Planctomycetes bacterium]|jgi:hypothetical protein|nr:hypothetical protein [Planctomycetota bacterium]
MDRMFRMSGSGVAIFLVAVLSMAPSCPRHIVGEPEADGAGVRIGKHTIDGVSTQTVDLVPDPGAPPSARVFIPSTARLTPLYTVEVTVGFPDPADAASFAGHAGLENRVTGSSPLDFHGIYIRSTPGGPQAFSVIAVGGGLLLGGSPVTFPGANWVDLRITNNGSGVYFYARRTGDPDFIWIQGQPAPAGVYSPGIAAYDFGGGPSFSFLDPVVTHEPDPQDPVVFENAYEALIDSMFRDVCFPLEHAGSLAAGPGPDITAAATIIDGLAAGLPALRSSVTALPADTPGQQDFLTGFERSLVKLEKQVLKARKTANRGKSPLKTIAKARLLLDSMIGALRQR